MLYCVVLYCVVLYCVVLYCMVLYFVVCNVWYCMLLYVMYGIEVIFNNYSKLKPFSAKFRMGSSPMTQPLFAMQRAAFAEVIVASSLPSSLDIPGGSVK